MLMFIVWNWQREHWGKHKSLFSHVILAWGLYDVDDTSLCWNLANKSKKSFFKNKNKEYAQWFLGGRKWGKKYWKFQQISDKNSWGYVRNLVRFGANKISLEMGGDRCSFLARIIVFQKTNGSEVKFSPTFCHLQRKSSCHMGILAVFSLAVLSGK